MGILWSRFRKKATTKEKLIKLEEEIDSLAAAVHLYRQKQKSWMLLLLVVSTTFFLGSVIVFYFWYMPKDWIDRMLCLIPFLAFPVIIFLMKKTLHFWFVRKIRNNSLTLEEKKKENVKLLENVMETETYKVAKELLEKFDPHGKVHTPAQMAEPRPENIEGPRQRQVAGKSSRSGSTGGTVTPGNTLLLGTAQASRTLPGAGPQFRTPTPVVQGIGTPMNRPQSSSQMTSIIRNIRPNLLNAPILPRDRSVVDKVAEYFIGDGPNNRYALICRNCCSHNGMAMAEEFEYMAYRCCYCGIFNPARKQRGRAPQLATPQLSPASSRHTSDTESETPSKNKLKTSVAAIGVVAKDAADKMKRVVESSDDEGLGKTSDTTLDETDSQASKSKEEPSVEPDSTQEEDRRTAELEGTEAGNQQSNIAENEFFDNLLQDESAKEEARTSLDSDYVVTDSGIASEMETTSS